MSTDLFERETAERLGTLAPAMVPEAGAWDGFARGVGLAVPRLGLEVGRGMSMISSLGAIGYDRFTGGTEAQDRYFMAHDETIGAAVERFTPKPGEVGVAGQVVGELLALLPLIIASPPTAVAALQMREAENLVRAGAPADKAVGVGAVQAAGLAAGIWVPILGRTLTQRMLLGGAGFNVTQGVVTRGMSQAILGTDPRASMYPMFDPTNMSIDLILGLAFGGMAHLTPGMRAQGGEALERITKWLENAKPSDIDALAALRQAQHLNADSLQGKPVDAEAVMFHVERTRTAIDQLARDRPVEVSDLPEPKMEADPVRAQEDAERLGTMVEAAEEVRRAEGLPEVPASTLPPRIPDSVLSTFPDMQVADGGGIGLNNFSIAEQAAMRVAGVIEEFTTAEGTKYQGVDPENLWKARKERQEETRRGRTEQPMKHLVPEDLTKVPIEQQPAAIGRAVENRRLEMGASPELARADAAIWEAWFSRAAARYGVAPADLMATYGIDVRRLSDAQDLPGAMAQEGGKFKLKGQTQAEAKVAAEREEQLAKEAIAAGKPPPAKKVTADQADLFNTQGTLFQEAARKQTESPAFKKWFGDSKVVDAEGKPLVVHHGTGRPDRIGKVFRKDRATSGPMAFFTDDPKIASNYAEGKQDTSMSGDEMMYDQWFQFVPRGARSPRSVTTMWHQLTNEQRAHFNEMLLRIRENETTGAVEDGGERGGISPLQYEWELRQAHGNGLKAAVELWLSSGSLFNQEEKFLAVLKMSGIPMKGIDYIPQTHTMPAVYPVHLSIQRPLDTGAIPADVVQALDDASKRARRSRTLGSGDPWDKRTRFSPSEWIAALKEDLVAGKNSFVWTSIPDWVTTALKNKGYDGIRDTGGKMGGEGHSVWVPFEETQVKSAIGNRGTFDPNDQNILHQTGRRGLIQLESGKSIIGLFKEADESSFMHESGHLFLQMTRDLASRAGAPLEAMDDWATLAKWLKIEGGELTREQHEKFATGFERYLADGKAPSPELKGVFAQFRDWLLAIYKSLANIAEDLPQEIRGVMDRMLASQKADPAPKAEGPPAQRADAEPPPPPGTAEEAGTASPEAPKGLDDLQMRDIVQGMVQNEFGWEEIGGRLIRVKTGERAGQETISRTKWIPRSELWPGRPDKSMNEARASEAVRKAMAGEKLKPAEQRMVDYMLEIGNERLAEVQKIGQEEWNALAMEMESERLEPSTENVIDADLVTRATAKDEIAVERAALKYDNDDQAFMAEVRKILGKDQNQETAGRGEEGEKSQAGERAGEGKGQDPVAAAAEEYVASNPDQVLHLGTDENGAPIQKTVRQFLDDALQDAKEAREDAGLVRAAAKCLLGRA